MSVKKYELLKKGIGYRGEIPTGLVVELNSSGNQYWDNYLGYTFDAYFVENNPEWFREITEQPSLKQEEFAWTDELVGEYGEWYRLNQGSPKNPSHLGMNRIDAFKDYLKSQSKQQPLPKRSSEMFISETPFENRIGEYPPSQPENISRDWEIVAYSCKFLGQNNIIFEKEIDGGFRVDIGARFYYQSEDRLKKESEACLIHSVKRLSDGITFSVGDEVGVEMDNSNIIEGFKIKDDRMLVKMKNRLNRDWEGGVVKIAYISKPSSQISSKERIEVDVVSGNNGKPSTVFTILSKKKISIEQSVLIKKAIENILNS